MGNYFSEVFERDNHRYIYCGRDMLTDFETFQTTELDHLVPASRGGPDATENLVTACSVCNRLKGNFDPGDYDPLKTEEYIDSIRRHIMKRRAIRMADFISWTHPKQK